MLGCYRGSKFVTWRCMQLACWQSTNKSVHTDTLGYYFQTTEARTWKKILKSKPHNIISIIMSMNNYSWRASFRTDCSKESRVSQSIIYFSHYAGGFPLLPFFNSNFGLRGGGIFSGILCLFACFVCFFFFNISNVYVHSDGYRFGLLCQLMAFIS